MSSASGSTKKRKPKMMFSSKKPRPKPEMFRPMRIIWVELSRMKTGYRIGKKIEHFGRFGEAFKVQRKRDKKVFIGKTLNRGRFFRLDKDKRKREKLLWEMYDEMRTMGRLSHKFIINLMEITQDETRLWMIMEQRKGGNLTDRLAMKGRFNEQDSASILRMMLDALFYMHDHHRVVHCDLNPHNILFVNKDEDSLIKIAGFGMSKVLPQLRSSQLLSVSPFYTAPEVRDGAHGHSADVWSVGVIMFEMLFGYPPFYVDPAAHYGRDEADAIYDQIKKGFSTEVKRGCGPWFPIGIPVSSEARDLMSRLMEADHVRRLTAKEALMHPWIRNEGAMGADAKEEDACADDAEEEGVPFLEQCQTKRAVIHLFRDEFTRMNPSHFLRLREWLQSRDSDGSGVVSFPVFQRGLVEVGMDEARVGAISAHSSASGLRFQGLLDAAVHDYLVSGEERLYNALRVLDEDEDGLITMDQLREQLVLCDPFGLSDSFLDGILSELDSDGRVDYEEFLRALLPDLEEKWS